MKICWRRNTILRNIDKIRKNENEDYFDEYFVTNMEDFVRSVNNVTFPAEVGRI